MLCYCFKPFIAVKATEVFLRHTPDQILTNDYNEKYGGACFGQIRTCNSLRMAMRIAHM